jgi:hypothetical protein
VRWGRAYRRYPTSPGTSFNGEGLPAETLLTNNTSGRRDNLDGLSRRCRPWSLKDPEALFFAEKTRLGGAYTSSGSSGGRLLNVVHLYMSWCSSPCLTPASKQEKSTVAYLTLFTCLQGSVWRIHIAQSRAIPALGESASATQRSDSFSPTKLSHASLLPGDMRSTAGPALPARASLPPPKEKGRGLNYSSDEDSESRATAVLGSAAPVY